MIQPTDVLVVAVAASLRRSRRVRRMTQREAHHAVQTARAAWPALRATLFADVRRVA
jgi:hypothetical protein